MHARARTESAQAHHRGRGLVSRRFASNHGEQYMLQVALSQQVLTTYQTAFCEMPLPHTLPSLATARKILPSLTQQLVSTGRERL